MTIMPKGMFVDDIKEVVILINNKPKYRIKDKTNIIHCSNCDAKGSTFKYDGRLLETITAHYSKRYKNLLLSVKEVRNETKINF